jgi:tetratricopeptide (TPR) repeat protein
MNLKENIVRLSGDDKKFDFSSLFSEKCLYTFLVGAGISMDPPSNVPSARMFVKELFNYYAPKEEIEHLEQLESLRYEFLVEKVQNLFDKDLKFLDYLDQVKQPNAIHVFLANMIMRYNYVITTNFDYLIETAMKNILSTYPMYHNYHQNFMIIITRDDYEKNVRLKFPVIKIHGSKWDCIQGRLTSKSLITTISALGKEREKGKTFAIEPYKKKLVDSITRDQILVVMGYSGSDDFDISPMLKELNLNKALLWIEHDQNVESGKEEVYQYKPLDNLTEAKSFAEFTKLDKLLIELASIKNLTVYKIKARTIDFVKNTLAPIYRETFNTLKEEESGKIISFNEYMKQHHLKVIESSKYRLAHEIYYDLGEIESAERTALQGLNLSKQESDKINETYFTNAIGLIELSKGNNEKALAQFESTLQLTENTNQINEKVAVFNNLAELYRKKGDLKNVFTNLTKASNLMNDNSPNLLKFSILNGLGVLYRDNGDVNNAVKNLEAALEIAEKAGDLFNKALCYNNLAGIKISQGQLNPALNYASEALKIDEQLGDLDEMSSTLNTIGNIYRVAGYYDQALQYLQRAYQIATKIQKFSVISLAVNAIGVIYFQLGKLDLAMEKYSEAYEIRKKTGDLSGQATSLNNLSLIYRAKSDYKTALEYLNQSIAITEQIGEKNHLGLRYGNRASIYEARKEFEKALEEYKKALAIEQSQEHLEGMANQLTNIGGILGDLGRYDETLEHYEKALKIMENLGIKPGIAQALNDLGIIYYKYKKNYERSIDYLQRALEIYKELNISNMIMTTMNNLDHIKREFESK